MKKFLILFLLNWNQLDAQEVKTDTLWITNTPIRIQNTRYGSEKKLAFINLHANETTSIAAAKDYLENNEGHLVELQHDTTRLIHFKLYGRDIQFDPNRIFTDKGRQLNLKLLNGKTLPAAKKNIAILAERIITSIKKARVIIAMHNNTDGKPLSVKSFKQKYVNPEMDPDDFILTTETTIFNKLRKKKINAVLQTSKTSTDDGSLAIYCSKKKIPYINIEAQEGHREEQVNMMNALTDIIKQYTR